MDQLSEEFVESDVDVEGTGCETVCTGLDGWTFTASLGTEDDVHILLLVLG